ncbi:MAG: DUF493 domain-containing protein [Ruminobacter sp.]|jgi:hypothetical protein|uniref:HP0495 family protein n=1 Tax=unclassified Ruminobacter TaxID=2627913 RepID=UPI0004E176D6|nr:MULTISPECIES: DUF493 domain-containing protein [unclassified Ruminobacter]MBQ3774822.1 DUF493 domain-containing protein [Ruminobacter sp.]
MTDNTNAPEKEEPKLEELIQFPAKLTFKFIGNNNDAVEGIIKTFFDEKLAIGAQISEGRKSRTGKYVTFNVSATVNDKETLHRIYNEGAELPHVQHVL